MSIAWLNYVLDDSPATGGARLVHLVLADRANDDGRCFPSLADVARRARLSVAQARRQTRRLIALGQLQILKPGGGVRPGGRVGNANLYQLLRTDGTLAPAQGLPGTTTLASAPQTLASARLNPSARARKPSRRRQPNQQEPTVEPSNNQQGHALRSHGTVVAAVADPKGEEFQKALDEKRADFAHAQGGRAPRPAASGMSAELRKGFRGERPRESWCGGRIPEGEQRRTFELLQGVSGLDRADARDLARIAPYPAFEQALAAMDGRWVRNPGGWLRRAVMNGWKATGKNVV